MRTGGLVAAFVLLTLAAAPSSQAAPPILRLNPGVREFPADAPPPPRVETFERRRGYTWIPGEYQWKRGRWVWVSGRYEQRHEGKRWRSGRWEREGERYVYVAGAWEDAYPTDPPPPPQSELAQTHRGQIWVAGFYSWEDGQYIWSPGHLESRQKGRLWLDARWERQGDRFVFVAGSWIEAPRDPVAAPPVAMVEADAGRHRKGSVWISGAWKWDAGEWTWEAGRWEREQSGKHWRETRWEQDGDHWVRREGAWEDGDEHHDRDEHHHDDHHHDDDHRNDSH